MLETRNHWEGELPITDRTLAKTTTFYHGSRHCQRDVAPPSPRPVPQQSAHHGPDLWFMMLAVGLDLQFGRKLVRGPVSASRCEAQGDLTVLCRSGELPCINGSTSYSD